MGVEPPACGVTGSKPLSGVLDSFVFAVDDEGFTGDEERSMGSSGELERIRRFALRALSSARVWLLQFEDTWGKTSRT